MNVFRAGAAGHTGLQRSIGFPVLQADFGDGYYASAIIGSTLGLRSWTVTWRNKHRDYPLIQAKTYNNVDVGTPVPVVQYITDFFTRRLQNGNDPFWFKDINALNPGDRIDRLCRFVENTLQFQQDSRDPLRWSISVKIVEVRGVAAQS